MRYLLSGRSRLPISRGYLEGNFSIEQRSGKRTSFSLLSFSCDANLFLMLVKGSLLPRAEVRGTFIYRGNRVVAQAALPGSLRSEARWVGAALVRCYRDAFQSRLPPTLMEIPSLLFSGRARSFYRLFSSIEIKPRNFY